MNSRALRLAGPLILVAAAITALLLGLVYGGGAQPLLLGDPGPLVRWGLPASTLVVNLTAAGMVGSLVLALFALRAGERPFDTALGHRERGRVRETPGSELRHAPADGGAAATRLTRTDR